MRISLMFVPKDPIDKNSALVRVNGLTPNKGHPITWTIAGRVHWHMYAALKGGELAYWTAHSYLTGVCYHVKHIYFLQCNGIIGFKKLVLLHNCLCDLQPVLCIVANEISAINRVYIPTHVFWFCLPLSEPMMTKMSNATWCYFASLSKM